MGKKIIIVIGSVFLYVMLFGGIVALGRALYTHHIISLIALIGCPFAAYYLINSNQAYFGEFLKGSLIVLLALTAVCVFTIWNDHNKTELKLDSYFLKGETKHSQVWIEEGYENDNDNDHYIPAHYETQYYFELAPQQSKFWIDFISWTLLITTIGIPILMYFITKKHLF